MEKMLITEFYKLYQKEGLSPQVIKTFQNMIYSYYKQHRRDFPFRNDITPYNVLVSEIMLQQTQTGRVAEKFLQFKGKFEDFKALSKAPLEQVLKAWQGLGYNRRAIALKNIAEMIVNEFGGVLPDSVEELKKFPQIGHNTASSIVAFAFNKPVFFIETNIRRVYFYYFFAKKNKISDKEILALVEKTTDISNPREWYYALMDYGVMLKKTHPELNKKSAHYRKQAPFKGSNRELRGKVLKTLINDSEILESDLSKKLKVEIKKLKIVIEQLKKEGFVTLNDGKVLIKK